MKNFRLRAPSPALLISVIALFVALGGTTYAATTGLPANSVGTKQIKNLAVTGPKLADGAVTAGKIDTTGLTVPNADAVGGVTVADLQRRISESCDPGSAIRTVEPDGTVKCQETPGGVAWGNVVLAGLGCEVAAPDGSSATVACFTGSVEPFELPLPPNWVLRNLRAHIPAALAHDDVYVSIASSHDGGFESGLFCTIHAGDTSCTSAGPMAPGPGGENIVLQTQTNAPTRLLFSYEVGPA